MATEKLTGTVKFFNVGKGFGFIRQAGSGEETFVHISGLLHQVKEGDQVEYETLAGRKGVNAVNVRLVPQT